MQTLKLNQKISRRLCRFPRFPRGKNKSSRFPGFPGVLDTLYKPTASSYLHFNGCIPRESWLAGPPLVFSSIYCKTEPLGYVTTLLWAGCPSCYPPTALKHWIKWILPDVATDWCSPYEISDDKVDSEQHLQAESLPCTHCTVVHCL